MSWRRGQAYGQDLRDRVLGVPGLRLREVAERFGVRQIGSTPVGHVSDIAEANALLHGQESVAFGDAGYQGVEKRPDAIADVTWHVSPCEPVSAKR